MDDATIAGPEETVLSDLGAFKTKLNETGVKINNAKYEVTLLHHISQESEETVRAFREILPGIKIISGEGCSMLETHLSSKGITDSLETNAAFK